MWERPGGLTDASRLRNRLLRQTDSPSLPPSSGSVRWGHVGGAGCLAPNMSQDSFTQQFPEGCVIFELVVLVSQFVRGGLGGDKCLGHSCIVTIVSKW
jgi:hypothetical protein